MATWNADIPALANQLSSDIPDIEENFQELHDVITAITNGTLGTTTAANFRVDVLADASTMTSPVVTTGFNDGTQAISWPTNGMSAAKFMLGNSNTIAWFYLNAAPPGWKVLSTGADTVLAVSGGAATYNANGGTAGGDFDIATANMPAHTHTKCTLTAAGGGSVNSAVYAGYSGDTSGQTFNTGSTGSGDGLYRPAASIGKLFQLDTA